MFRCQHCGKPSALYEQPVRLPVEFRRREYPAYERLDGTKDLGGEGHEIVHEVTVHKDCVGLVAVGPIPARLTPKVMDDDDIENFDNERYRE